MSPALLQVEGVSARYGSREPILRGIDLSLHDGETLGVVGMNGAGKSSLMRVINGRLRPSVGRVLVDGVDVARRNTAERARMGIVQLAEGHRVIRPLTVHQNLETAAMTMSGVKVRRRLAEVLPVIHELFPVLEERSNQLAGLLSGGEQQMLSVARAMVQRPRLLLLDEPSLGLAPLIIDRIYDALEKLRASGMSMLIVEQNSQRVARACSRLCVLRDGRVVDEGRVEQIDSARLQRAYFGRD